MNRFETLLIVGAAGALLYFIIKKSKKQNYDSPIKEKHEQLHSTDEVEYLHTSVLKNIFLQYGVDYTDENAFFNLRDCIMKKITKITTDRILNYINSIIKWDKVNLSKLVELYDSILQEKTKLNIKKCPVEIESPKIYLESIGDYVKDFNLKGNFETIVFDFLDKFHDMAKDQVIRSIKVNMNWIRDNIDYALENRSELDDIIKSIKERIN